MATPSNIFRFMELPGELRNKIYQELLCSFTFYEEPRHHYVCELRRLMNGGQQGNANEPKERPDTSILLVSRMIHREAYDVMVRVNQFIRVQSRDFWWLDVLPEAHIPVVSMDRQRVAQFKGYMLCMKLSYSDLDSAEEHRFTVSFDFMILGRHWEFLCRSISYLYTRPQTLRIFLTFDSACIIEQRDCKIPADTSFMKRTESELLEPPQTYWRGIHSLTINGLLDESLGDKVRNQAVATPWTDTSAWLSRLEERIDLEENLQPQREVTDIFSWFEEIDKEARFIPEQALDADPYSRQRQFQICLYCATGKVRCFQEVLVSMSQDTSNRCYLSLKAHAYDIIKTFLRYPTPQIRVRFMLLEAKLKMITELDAGQRADLHTAQYIAYILLQAEELDPGNEEIRGEQQRFLEMSGLLPLSIREIATAL